MTRRVHVMFIATALALVSAGVAYAQQPVVAPVPPSLAPAPAPAPRTAPPLLLKVQVVISRYQGEKKLSSQPYTLTVRANERSTNLRMGVQVPVPSSGPEGKIVVVYKDVGTSIDCSAQTLEDGRFRLDMSLEDSSLDADNQPAQKDVPPRFRSFRVSNETVVLRDGQTTQLITAAEKPSGEIAKVDVTLNVVR